MTIAHVHELLLDATAVNLDALLSAIFTGQPERIIELTSKVSFADIDNNRMFAAAQRYALAVHRARAEMESGASPDDSPSDAASPGQWLQTEIGNRDGACPKPRGQDGGLHRRHLRRRQSNAEAQYSRRRALLASYFSDGKLNEKQFAKIIPPSTDDFSELYRIYPCSLLHNKSSCSIDL